MGRLRLRHRADGAQGVVELGGGGNSVPGESAVFVVTAATSATSIATAAVSATTSAAAATVSTAVCAVAAEFAQELVLVLDAPFTRPQLQHRPAEPKVEVRELEGHPRTSAKIDLDVVARFELDSLPRLPQPVESYAEILWNFPVCF